MDFKRILVIGAAGQIGSDLVPILYHKTNPQNTSIRLVDLLTSDSAQASANFDARGCLSWRSDWRVCNAAEPGLAKLIREFKPDLTFHLAALLSGRAEQDPSLCWQVNMNSLIITLDALSDLTAELPRPRIVWPSSVGAFGPVLRAGSDPAFDQVVRNKLYPHASAGYPAKVGNDAALFPTSIYGVTKVAGELLGAYYSFKKGIDFRSLRFPGLLNAAPPGGGSSDYANMMYFAAVGGMKKVKVFVDEKARMPFMYMPDAVKALIDLAVVDENRLTRRTYNITAFSPTAKELELEIRKTFPSFSVEYSASDSNDPRFQNVNSWPDDMDDALATSDWDWKAESGLAETTSQVIEEIRKLPKERLAEICGKMEGI
jgi:nucleoside-diphosphate-sugar epimerase